MSMAHGIIDNPALLDGWISQTPTTPGLDNLVDAQALAQKRARIAGHLQAMDSLSSDRRIRYLTEHGFDDTYIRELLGKIQQVINRDYDETIRQMATNHARQGNSLADVAEEIFKTNIVHDLAAACYRNGGETDVIAAAYANHELYYTLNAALNVARLNREQTDTDNGTAHDPQHSERDQALAETGLAEDAGLWPEY